MEPKTLEAIPFEPLPDKPAAPPPVLEKEEKKEVALVQKPTNQETQSENQFGGTDKSSLHPSQAYQLVILHQGNRR